MKKKDILFKAFLVAYIVFLFIHGRDLEWTNFAILGFLFGLLLAYFAHARKGFLTILLLAVHMSIEWFHHVKFGTSYSVNEIILNGVHVIFDFVFLASEWKRHSKNAFVAVLSGVSIGLVSIFVIGTHYHENDNHEEELLGEIHADEDESEHESEFPFEAIIIGGILGCAITHLVERKK